MLRELAKSVMPDSVRTWIRKHRQNENIIRPVRRSVNFGDLRQLTPVSPIFGLDRGQPLDRYYIDRFLAKNASYVSGHVLEVAEDTYARKFGGDRVSKCDILHFTEGNQNATILADLTRADNIPSDTFDCIILTQTLQFIFKIEEAITTLHRILRRGAILLATFPGISQISRYDMNRWGDYWRLTSLSARILFEKAFGKDNVIVETYGNVLTTISFLQGLASEEFRKEELEHNDPDYELLIGVKAVK